MRTRKPINVNVNNSACPLLLWVTPRGESRCEMVTVTVTVMLEVVMATVVLVVLVVMGVTEVRRSPMGRAPVWLNNKMR